MKYIISLLSAILVTLLLYNYSFKLIGVSPKIKVAEYEKKFKNWEELSLGNDIAKMRTSLLDIEETLKVKPEQKLVFLYISILKKIVEISPQSSNEILKLADLSFDKQIFDISEKYFRDYLVLKPEDDDVKAKLASSLTFQNKLPESEKILRELIKKNSKEFRNYVYLSINLVQQNKKKDAIKLLNTAMDLTSDSQTKDKLLAFLNKLSVPEWLVNLGNQLSESPMIGSKLQDLQIENDILDIYLTDFPMQAMPENVRSKFINNIIEKIDKKIKVINFYDVTSNKIIYTENIKR